MPDIPVKPAASAVCARSTSASSVNRICGRNRWNSGIVVSSVGRWERTRRPGHATTGGVAHRDYESRGIKRSRTRNVSSVACHGTVNCDVSLISSK